MLENQFDDIEKGTVRLWKWNHKYKDADEIYTALQSLGKSNVTYGGMVNEYSIPL